MAAADSDALITTSIQEGLLLIGMNRASKRNALTGEMYRRMAEALLSAEQDSSIRVILLHGSEHCFTSGNDLGDFSQQPPTDENSPVFRFLLAISQARKPLVAAVSGPAIGIGTTMLLHCDLVYAGENASFQLPFVNLGLSPEGGSSLLLPRLVGHQQAAELLLLGQVFSAETAYAAGFLNAVVATDEVLAHALSQAQLLAKQPPEAVRLTKRLLKESQGKSLSAVLSEEGRYFIERLASPEAAEAFAAFFTRRPADFSQF